jgi:hypothetical protein
MLKIGKKGKSYVFITPDVSESPDGYRICVSDEGEEYRTDSLSKISKMAVEVKELYPEQRVFLIKQEQTIIEKIQ